MCGRVARRQAPERRGLELQHVGRKESQTAVMWELIILVAGREDPQCYL